MKEWQIESMCYFGRHEQRIPAYDGHPYPIIRAIPVEGTVGPSWAQSPQVKFWLDGPEKTLWERFLAWWNK